MVPKGLIGVVHLPALPGDPGYDGAGFVEILERATADARTLAEGGAAGVIVENFGSTPFSKDRLSGFEVASITRAVLAVKEAVRIPIGVNCLRSDASSALGIATATEVDFIRINVHTGVYQTDQGVIEGQAHDTLRERAQLDSNVAILADVLVKHAQPLAPISPADAARDAVERGRADGVIVTGSATGDPANALDVEAARAAVGDEVIVVVGSGVNETNAADLLPHADAAIVGTSLKVDGDVTAPVDLDRVRTVWAACRGVFR